MRIYLLKGLKQMHVIEKQPIELNEFDKNLKKN